MKGHFSMPFKAFVDIEFKVSIFPCGENGCQFNSAIRDTPHISPISYTRSYNPLLRSEAVQRLLKYPDSFGSCRSIDTVSSDLWNSRISTCNHI